MRILTQTEVTFRVEVEQDDLAVRGNAMASDDPDFDREVEDKILAELDAGNVWAWCYVRVVATHPDFPDLYGEDTIGACSYADEADFRADGYYADMCGQAVADLNDKIARVVRAAKGEVE